MLWSSTKLVPSLWQQHAGISTATVISCQPTAPLSLRVAFRHHQKRSWLLSSLQRRCLAEGSKSPEGEQPRSLHASEVAEAELPEPPPTGEPPTVSPDPPSPTAELPSQTRAQWSQITVLLNQYTDQLLRYLASASHRVNTLTGTDYSGIAALRESIAQHESKVKAAQLRLAEARSLYETALATQAASQKEVVQLLERKHSWSAEDLERYMGLIRSEHVNEQAVGAAKSDIEQWETKVEQARQAVERSERRQYHEEQIWSDTIRRNSTWITFGLMGVNILLLLVNLFFIEPWRRARMVREIKGALDDKAVGTPIPASGRTESAVPLSAAAAVEAVTFSSRESIEAAEGEARQEAAEAEMPLEAQGAAEAEVEEMTTEAPGSTARGGEDAEGAEAALFSTRATDEAGLYIIDGKEVRRHAPVAAVIDEEGNYVEVEEKNRQSVLERFFSLFRASAWRDAYRSVTQHVLDSLSEQEVILRRIDLTTRFTEGVALGATCMMVLFVLFPIIADIAPLVPPPEP